MIFLKIIFVDFIFLILSWLRFSFVVFSLKTLWIATIFLHMVFFFLLWFFPQTHNNAQARDIAQAWHLVAFKLCFLEYELFFSKQFFIF